MADCVLVAADNVDTDALLGVLAGMPDVAAIAGLPLSTILFESARSGIRVARSYRRAAAGGGAVSVAEEIDCGMVAGRAALDTVLRDVRARARRRHVILHDSRGLAFPLADASGIKIMELVRNRWPEESDAKAAIRAALNGRRGPDRFPNAAGYLWIDEERLGDEDDALRAEIAVFLEAGERGD